MMTDNFLSRLHNCDPNAKPLDPTVETNVDHYLSGPWTFEEVADVYYKETGFMRPGKDDARGIHSRYERQENWMNWLARPYVKKVNP
jgi:hypothetical protein